MTNPTQPETLLDEAIAKLVTNTQGYEPVLIEEAIKQLILAHRKQAKLEEVRALVNMPGATHSDTYYAAVKRLAELEEIK